ncbi:hypothetical protein HMPREF0307_00567 [Corynebacterium sp. DNF00584]|nr:hypothetical protein HMPREF0307_00567 [Corynebacterium sp. DNF00584]
MSSGYWFEFPAEWGVVGLDLVEALGAGDEFRGVRGWAEVVELLVVVSNTMSSASNYNNLKIVTTSHKAEKAKW